MKNQTTPINATISQVLSLPSLTEKKSRNTQQKSSMYGCLCVGSGI